MQVLKNVNETDPMHFKNTILSIEDPKYEQRCWKIQVIIEEHKKDPEELRIDIEEHHFVFM